MGEGQALRWAPWVAVAEGEHRYVILDTSQPESPNPVVLTGTAADIWRLFAEACTPSQVVDRLTGAYELTRTEVEADVTAFVAELQRLELIAPVAGDGRT